MSSVKTTASVKDFQSTIRKFQKADTASAHKLTKAEVSTALEILKKGGVSDVERKAATDVLSKAQLTKGAKELLENFVADAGKPEPQGKIKLSSERKALMTDIVKDNLRSGNVEWRGRDAVPMGLALRREPLFADKHPDGFSYVALIPNGSVDPRHMGGKDPNKASYFFVERSGGFAGMTQVAGPFDVAELKGKSAADVKKMLQGNDDLRGGVLRSAFPSYSRSTPPVIADVRKLDDGNFAVKVQLVHFMTREVQGEKDIKINADGRVLGPVGGGQVTTAAIGEEGGSTTEAVSEIPDSGATTLALGEEGGGVGGTTRALGEEGGGGGRVTTMAVGEEGGNMGSTEAVGEEGGNGGNDRVTRGPGEGHMGGGVTTMAVGEEGGGFRGGGAVTLAIPEN